jgi:dethiobiotin synthetase
VDVGVVKAVQTGEGDAETLRRWAELAEEPEQIAPLAFAAPLAPLVAARLEARTLELDETAARVRALGDRHDMALVEGAGGLLVPVGPDWTIGDLAGALGLPIVVVARAGLGTVNHTLLTVSEARRLGLVVHGVILNGREDRSTETNAGLIESFGDVRVLAQIPWLEGEITAARLRRLDLDFGLVLQACAS